MRWMITAWVLGLGALLVTCVPLAAHAQVYRCTTANGSVAFQDKPCVKGQQQKMLDVPSHAPPGYVPPPVATTLPQPVASAVPPPVYVPPPPPLPFMVACVDAVNGDDYLAHSPRAPYLVPLGILGYPPQTLSQAYGAPGGAGMSAPELAPKPRIGGPRIAAAMTWVQDTCQPATAAQVCAYVQKEYDENDQKLRAAMRDERAPLQQRSAQLQDQLRNCR